MDAAGLMTQGGVAVLYAPGARLSSARTGRACAIHRFSSASGEP